MSRVPVSDSESPPTAVAGCLEACRRCESLVESIAGEGATVAERAYAAVGPHLRHCLDHFSCLFRGFDTGVVDYDVRDRDLHIERDPSKCREALESTSNRLRGLTSTDEGKSLRIRQAAALGGRSAEVESNLERELAFLSGHTIHHLAIMRLLAEAQGVAVPQGLDLAFSTESHLDQSKQPT